MKKIKLNLALVGALALGALMSGCVANDKAYEKGKVAYEKSKVIYKISGVKVDEFETIDEIVTTYGEVREIVRDDTLKKKLDANTSALAK